MAHYAEIDSESRVLRVIVVITDDSVGDDGLDDEARGVAFCENLFGGTWLRTSYNTCGGQHTNGGTPFRYNYATVGGTFSDAPEWSAQGGAFIPPQPFPSWVLNPDTALWETPIPYPSDGGMYLWNESTVAWVAPS